MGLELEMWRNAWKALKEWEREWHEQSMRLSGFARLSLWHWHDVVLFLFFFLFASQAECLCLCSSSKLSRLKQLDMRFIYENQPHTATATTKQQRNGNDHNRCWADAITTATTTDEAATTTATAISAIQNCDNKRSELVGLSIVFQWFSINRNMGNAFKVPKQKR